MMFKNNKILVLSTLTIQPFLPVYGTPVVKYTLERFIKEGFKVFLLYSFKPDLNDEYFKQHIKCYYFHVPFSEKLVHLPYFRFFFRFFFWFITQIMFLIKGLKIIKQEKIDIIYVCDSISSPIGFLLSKIFNIPIVFRFYGSFISKRYHSLLSKIRFWHEVIAYKLTPDLTIMTDDGTFGEEVIRYFNNFNKNIRFWRNGVNFFQIMSDKTKYKEYLQLDDKFVLLTVSRLDKWKRVDRAIIILSKVISLIPNCMLLIVGDGTEKSNLISIAKKLNVYEYIKFVGQKKSDELINYYGACDIFLSLYDISNVCNPLFEAMIAGCTIVTLNNGDTSKYIKNYVNGLIVEDEELEIIPDLIVGLYQDEELQKKLGQKAKEFAYQNFYSWDQRFDMEIQEIRKLLR